MSHDYKQLSVHRVTPAIWRVTFDNAPINLVDFETLDDLQALVTELEGSPEVKVVVFDSADPEFFLAHWDIAATRKADADGPAASWTEISLRLAHAPVVSIALIRGRARGLGSEIALGLDMRFASIERAILAQPEVGVGLIPGGGSVERLSLLAGRARALEIVLGAGDYDASTAERYGWINRALPDAQLDGFVDDLARRLASFDKPTLAEAKRLLNRQGIPAAEDMQASTAAFRQAFSWPGTKVRAKALMGLGFGSRNDFEMRFGDYLAGLVREQDAT